MKIQLIPDHIDKPFLPLLKPVLSGYNVSVSGNLYPDTLAEAALRAKANGCDAVITSNPHVVKLLLQNKFKKHLSRAPKLDPYEGSYFEAHDLKWVVGPPAKQIASVAYGSHWMKRCFSKLTAPENWFQQTPFIWDTIDEFSAKEAYDAIQPARAIAVDIETSRDGLRRILCVNYTGIFFNSKTREFYTRGYVLPINSMRAVGWMRAFNRLPNPKVFQNGKYDNAYFTRYGSPVTNWFFDTLHGFHCYYSEMPKELSFLTAYLIRDVVYWKDQSTEDLYKYNAMDGWATANAWLALMREAPAYWEGNYAQEFPLVFPCLQMDLDGLAVDDESKAGLLITQHAQLDESLLSIRKKLGVPKFNPGSPVQCKKLLQVLLCNGKKPLPAELMKIDSSDKRAMLAAAEKHPLNQLLIEDILEYRQARKLLSDYIEAELYNGRFLYSHNPGGTDTGRLASNESYFWCGHQIQNMPAYCKQMFIADPGYHLCEIDKAQSESWCTGFLSGDPTLISTLQSGRDFHSVNAAAFFGLDYERDLWDSEREETRNKPIRDLSKRTNHGANYNMQENMLLITMGAKNVIRAKVLLKLPGGWPLRRVCKYLLDQFDRTYPVVRSQWYDHVRYCIAATKLLVGPTGWTRYCFGDPDKNKRHLNAYVAHPPQSLSVMVVNRGLEAIHRELQGRDLRLKAQIHDSILFQYRIGRLDLVQRAEELMRVTVPVTDCFGTTRELTIRNDIKCGARKWSDLKSLSKVLAAQ